MMPLPAFRLERPESLDEALRLLAQTPGALPVAGGTDLLVSIKHGLFQPPVLVDLGAVEGLERVDASPDGLELGAGVRISRLRDDPDIRRRFTALGEAAGQIASPLLQNMGTLGGNLCLDTRCRYYNQSAFWRAGRGYCLKRDGTICQAAPSAARCFAVCSSDTAPALIALGARVRLARRSGDGTAYRELPLERLYVEDGIGRLTLEPGELLAGVRLHHAPGTRSGFRKYRVRDSIDYPLASVAAALHLDSGVMRDVRVVVGALASSPVVATETMALLEGRRPEAGLLAEAAGLVTKGTKPVRNQASTPTYRRHMARVMCRRLLEELNAGTSSPAERAGR